jgi:hypothetical protein
MKKRILGVLFCAMFVITGMFSFNSAEKAQAQEMHVCPGTGESCNVEIAFGGNTVTVKSTKTKGGGSVVVKQQ